jgi:glucose-1-phosphate cytidylyltransferase
MEVHQRYVEPWRVTLVDTGEHTMTGGRLKRVAEFLKDEESFCFTYGDGVSDVDITGLIAFHRRHGKLATVTAVQPPGRYGALVLASGIVEGFCEKPPGDGAWINGGFFVLNPATIEHILDDNTSWEDNTLVHLASLGQLEAYQHRGFWQPMDTLREKNLLEELWAANKSPWKCWK